MCSSDLDASIVPPVGSTPEKVKFEYFFKGLPAIVTSSTTVDCPQAGFQVAARSVYSSLNKEITSADAAVGAVGAVVGAVEPPLSLEK